MVQNNPDVSPKDTAISEQAWWRVAGGVTLLGLSLVFVVGGVRLGLGSPFRLGTGAFPFLTGLILAAMSLAICVQEWRGDDPVEKPDWVAFASIIGALAIFALTSDRLGLVPGAFLTVVIASYPDRALPFGGKILLAALVAGLSWLLFIQALNLPFKAFVGV